MSRGVKGEGSEWGVKGKSKWWSEGEGRYTVPNNQRLNS